MKFLMFTIVAIVCSAVAAGVLAALIGGLASLANSASRPTTK